MARSSTKLAELSEQTSAQSDDLREIHNGLALEQKTLSPKFFYDERGSELFDEITRLPEYYLTTTERQIMQDNMAEIADLIGPRASIIEFGAGSSTKIRQLLSHLHEPAVYVPVDISGDYLEAAAAELAEDFPDFEILPVAADFTKNFELPNPRIMPERNIVFFPGSTIGNFSPEAALELLKVMHHEAGTNGGLLIGVDLRKDRETLEDAYNDSAGVTAEFNLNILQRMNREFDADIDVSSFEHEAIYNEDDGRIEMYLRSLRTQSFEVSDEAFNVAAGERILTEHSHKYSLSGFAALAAQAGFSVERVFTDAKKWFSVQYLTRD